MNSDRCGNTNRQKCHERGSRKVIKIQKFVCRDTKNVEPEMRDHTGNNWSHRHSNKGVKEKLLTHS